MVSPKTLRDDKHFTSAQLKTKTGCGENNIFYLKTTRESVLVAVNCTLLESPQKEIPARLSFKERFSTFSRFTCRLGVQKPAG